MAPQNYTIPASYFDFLDDYAKRYADKTALEMFADDCKRGYTYAQLHRMVLAVGSGLVSRGVRPGDRVAVLDENHPDWGVAFLGIWAAGGVAVPLDFRVSDFEVQNLLDFAECRHLFISAKRLLDLRAMLKGNGRNIQCVIMSGAAGDDGSETFESLQSHGTLPGVPVRTGHEETAAILFTSGTSADPKGVALSHGNLLHHNASLLQSLDVTERDSILGVLPLHHALALNANFLIPLSVGARVIYLSSVTSQKILAGIHQGQATLFACIPQFYYLLHQNILLQVKSRAAPKRWIFKLLKGLSRRLLRHFGIYAGGFFFPQIHAAFGRQLRFLASAGSYLDPEVIWDLSALGFRVIQAYGLTEATAALSVTPLSDNVFGSVGKILSGIELRIADPDDRGNGEIITRGPGLMQGYYKRPDLTAQAICQGWLYTGDLGHLDKKGSLYITGRKKDVIVLSNGKNIYPDELERHFLQCPMVKEVCVLGIESNDGGVKSERLHLEVVPDFEFLRQHKIANAGESVRFEIATLSNRLPSYKHITSLEVRSDPLPRTTTQKIRRIQLKKEVEKRLARVAQPASQAAAAAAQPAAPLTGPHSELVELIIRQYKRIDFPLSANHNLELDLGFDSLERLELLSALEQRLEVRLPESMAPQIYTLQDLLDGLARARPGLASQSFMCVSDKQAWSHLLATNTDDASYSKYFLDPKPVLVPIIFGIMRGLYYLSRVLLRLKVSGVENFPKEAPFLICPNHLSYVDPFFVVACLPYRVFRRIFFVGASEYFRGRIMGFLGRLANVIPIDPDSNLIQALRLGAVGLRHKKILCIFPEGSRSINGKLQDFHRGAAILAAEQQIPLVPVGLVGTYEVWPRDSMRIRLQPVTVRIGKPIYPVNNVPDGHAYPYEQVTAHLRQSVEQLIAR